MKISIIEKEKSKLKIELEGSSKSFAHFISSEIWELGGEAAALQEHPFMVNPKLLVKASNPKKIIDKAVESIEKKCNEIKTSFKNSK